jgi:hypothetical protein
MDKEEHVECLLQHRIWNVVLFAKVVHLIEEAKIHPSSSVSWTIVTCHVGLTKLCSLGQSEE